MKYLIVGLGNVGPEYTHTRHNIGFIIIDQLAKAHGATFDEKRLASIAHFKHRGRQLYLIKPNTYMNNSGKAVRYWLQNLQIPIERSLVIVDDIALPFGKTRIRPQGSSAGHNGLKSIEEMIGTQHYPRLRVGIGQNFSKGKQADYVLGQFTNQEKTELDIHTSHICEMIHTFYNLGIEKTMTQYN